MEAPASLQLVIRPRKSPKQTQTPAFAAVQQAKTNFKRVRTCSLCTAPWREAEGTVVLAVPNEYLVTVFSLRVICVTQFE